MKEIYQNKITMKKICFLYFILKFAVFCFGGQYHPTIQYIFPLPNSKMLPTKVTIILRLEPSFHSKITNLGELIHVQGDSSGVYVGTIFLATDNRTIIFKANKEFERGEQIHVKIQTTQFSANDFQFEFTIDKNQNQPPIPETQLKNNSQTHFSSVNDIPSPRVINGVTVPSDFPEITTIQKKDTAPGTIFFGTNNPEAGIGNYLIICKNDGTPYFYRRYNHIARSVDFTRQPLGVLTVHFAGLEHYIALDSNFVHIDTYTCGHGYTTDNHELLLLGNGHALIIAQEDLKIDMSDLIIGGNPNAVVQGNYIQKLDKDKNVIFEWRSWDYFDIRDAIGIDIKANYIDYVHINSIAVDYDSNLIISSRNLCEITKIDRKTGEIIWRLGGTNNQFDYIHEKEEIIYQHDARPVPGKPGNYTIFDNGRRKIRPFSRVVEYSLDLKNMMAENVWEYRYTPDRFSKSMGSAQRLPSGNTLIDWPNDELRACEVSPTGEIIYEIFSKGHSNYRCRRYQWDGKQKQPSLIIENFGSIVRLIFNKFGDQNVQYYKIYYGIDNQQMTLLDSTTETYYDVAYLRNKTQYFFRISAVDSQRNESSFSNPESAYVQIIEPGLNLIKNGKFNSLKYWELLTSGNASASATIAPNAPLGIVISKSGSDLNHIKLQQDQILLLQGRDYLLEFDAYATSDYRRMETKIESKYPPNPNYAKIGLSALRKGPQHFQYPFEMKLPVDSDARLVFNCGSDTSNIFIDNVSLKYMDENIDTTLTEFININFQPLNIALPYNYYKDSGEIYGIHPNGYKYGWIGIANPDATIRESLLDLRYTTFNRMQTIGTARIWEIELPNDSYIIRLVTGDPDSTNQLNHIQVENITLEDLDGNDNFDKYTTSVSIEDGRLTLEPSPNSKNLKICFINIYKRTTAIKEQNGSMPYQMMLAQNFPNPFNRSTTISFTVSQQEDVRITIFDILGRLTRTLLKKKMIPGHYSVKWDGKDDAGNFVSSGIYFYTLKTANFSDVKKLLLIK